MCPWPGLYGHMHRVAQHWRLRPANHKHSSFIARHPHCSSRASPTLPGSILRRWSTRLGGSPRHVSMASLSLAQTQFVKVGSGITDPKAPRPSPAPPGACAMSIPKGQTFPKFPNRCTTFDRLLNAGVCRHTILAYRENSMLCNRLV